MNIILDIFRSLNLVPVPLVDTQSQLARARVLLEANRLGVFHCLDKSDQGLSAEELAERTGISRRGADVVLAALYTTGYVKKRNGRYSNGRWAKTWITDPQSGMSNLLKLQFNVWERLELFGDILTGARSPEDLHKTIVSTPSEEQEVYTLAMRELARLLLPQFLKKAKLPEHPKRLLDIGGAHGEYSRALVRRYPGLEATVLDLPGPIATAEHIMQTEGNPEGLTLRAGNALEDDYGNGWDAVLLANVMHVFDPEQNAQLFEKIRASLVPTGVMIIMDQFSGFGRMRDMFPAMVSVNLFSTGGRCYSIQDGESMIRAAGFARTRVKRFVPWRGCCVLEGWTPAGR